MSDIEALNHLRIFADELCGDSYYECKTIADAIECEISERYVPLPFSKNGELIHIGDVLQENEDGHTFKVDGLMLWGNLVEWWAFQENGIQSPVKRCTHIKPDPLKELLEELVSEARQDSRDFSVEPWCDAVRELMGGDGQ